MALEQAIDRQTPEATSTRAGGATGAALHATPFAG
jgi:hypothetical protein